MRHGVLWLCSAGVAAGVTLSACGGPAAVDKSAEARATLSAEVARVSAAAAAHHRAAASTALDALRKSVASLEERNEMSKAAGHAVLEAASAVQSKLYLVSKVATHHRATSSSSTTSTTSSTTTTTSTPSPPGPGPGGGPPPGHGHKHKADS